MENESMKSNIIAIANQDHKKYPQYKGYWDGEDWKLIRIRRDIKTRFGLAFKKGELTIGKKEGKEVLAYSIKNKINTSIRLNEVEWL